MVNMNNEIDLISAIKSELRQVDADITIRNNYINERDRKIYDTGLFENLEFPDGSDKTLFNYLRRVVDIHTAQLMGRGFMIYSNYNKDNSELAEQAVQNAQPEQESELGEGQGKDASDKAESLSDLKNQKKQLNADMRKKLIDAIIRDNGGMNIFKHGARIGSAYGTTIYKMWKDEKNKKIKISLLETPQNYYAGWSTSEFREKDWDGYVYQISETQAYKLYGNKLPKGDMFVTTIDGNPLGNGNTNDPINTLNQTGNRTDTMTKRKMVSVVEFTGTIPGWGVNKDQVIKVNKGDEQPFNVLIVGNHIVQEIVAEDKLPKYYVIRNVEEPRRAWGASDVNTAAIEINKTMIEVMSTWITLFHKEVAPTYLAKGFEGVQIPQRRRKSTTFIPMSLEQDIHPLAQAPTFTGESQNIINTLKEDFIRVTGISRVMFDDPTISANSNQGLMTTMKGLIDAVEDKQTRWEPVITKMFTDALELTATMIPETKDAINDDDWFLYMEWPSVLRKEDAGYQQMWLNLFHAGVISLETYMEKLGFNDTTEEVDRIRDEMKDPTTAAVLGNQLGALAHQSINKSLGIPPWGYITPKVSLRGDLSPQEVGNMAHNYNWDEGPYGPQIGPQGTQGSMANTNFINSGFIQPGANGQVEGAQPMYQSPQQPLPTLTPDQNTGQTASMPGSGAPAVSPQGAINQINQRRGK